MTTVMSAANPKCLRSAAILAGTIALVVACSSDDSDDGARRLPPPTERVESGFHLTRDAFAFANFGGPDAAAQVNAETIARMFGDEGTCISRVDGACQPTALASLWMDHINRVMEGGRCEGFAVLSALMFTGDLASHDFGAPEAHALALAGNVKLASEIAYWFSTQFLQNVAKGQTRALGAKEAVSFLGGALPDRSAPYRIGIVRVDAAGRRAGGHAVLPYAVEPLGGGLYRIDVYDNNHPDEERFIEVDANTDRWSYRASSNPDDPLTLYEGSPENRNKLYFAPVRPRLGIQPCPFCSGTLAAGQEALAQIFTFGSVDAAVVDASGKRAGVAAGSLVSELDEVTVAPSFSDTLGDDAPVTIFAPAGAATNIELSPKNERSGDDLGAVRVLGRGFGASVEDVVVPANRLAHLRRDPARWTFFEPAAPQTFRLSSIGYHPARQGGGDEIVVSLEPAVPTSTSLGIRIDDATGNASLDARAGGAKLTLRIQRRSATRSDTFEGALDVPSGGAVDLDLAGWPGGAASIDGMLHVDGAPAEPIVLSPPNVVGHLYVSDRNAGSVTRFRVLAGQTPAVADGSFASVGATGMTFGPAGLLYVGDRTTGAIARFANVRTTPAARASLPAPPLPVGWAPSGVHFVPTTGGAGELWVASEGFADRLAVYPIDANGDAVGDPVLVSTGIPGGAPHGIQGLAYDAPSSSFFVAADQVRRFTLTRGTGTWELTQVDDPELAPIGAQAPVGVVVGPNRWLFAAYPLPSFLNLGYWSIGATSTTFINGATSSGDTFSPLGLAIPPAQGAAPPIRLYTSLESNQVVALDVAAAGVPVLDSFVCNAPAPSWIVAGD